MTLTVGTSLFGHRPRGSFNFELPRRDDLLYFERSPRRIRGIAGGETVIDSRDAKLLYEHGRLPLFYFPRGDVRVDLLQPSQRTEESKTKGPARYWSLQAGGQVLEDAAWEHPDPPAEAAFIADHLTFAWEAMDEWLEEDEPMIVHPRDPYHRIDVLDSSRQVEVRLGGETLADSRRTRALFETGLPTRWYFDPEDVRRELLVASDTRTGCAYKGYASYWSARIGSDLEDDLIWFYREPRPEAERIRDRLAFFNERVELFLDGELQESPLTQWSRSSRSAPSPSRPG